MTDPIRLDPSPSKVFSWLEWEPNSPESDHHPTTAVLRVRYRYNGSEWEFWPVSEQEAKQVMNPGPLYDYSIGKAFGDVIKAHKSGRLIKPGERQSTVKQREEAEARAGRRWLA
jgi:hypothetical protein